MDIQNDHDIQDLNSVIKNQENKIKKLEQDNELLQKDKYNMKIQFEAQKLMNIKDKSEISNLNNKIEELEKELKFTRSKLDDNNNLNETMTDLNHDLNLDLNIRRSSNNDLNNSFTETIHTIDNKNNGKYVVDYENKLAYVNKNLMDQSSQTNQIEILNMDVGKFRDPKIKNNILIMIKLMDIGKIKLMNLETFEDMLVGQNENIENQLRNEQQFKVKNFSIEVFKLYQNFLILLVNSKCVFEMIQDLM